MRQLEEAAVNAQRAREMDAQRVAQQQAARKKEKESEAPVVKVRPRQGHHSPVEETRKEGAEGAAASADGSDGAEQAPMAKLVPALLKADSAGALEAVHESISHFPEDKVQLKVIRAELGEVRAQTSWHACEIATRAWVHRRGHGCMHVPMGAWQPLSRPRHTRSRSPKPM